LDTIDPAGLKKKAKSWLTNTPALYRPMSAAYRSVDVLRGMMTVAAQRSKIMMGAYPVIISYPGQLSPRWTNNVAGHPGLAKIIDENRSEYRGLIADFGAFRAAIESVPNGVSDNPTDPSWTNSFLTGIDAVALYGMLASRRPKRYFEIGSGNSTRLARWAIRNHGLATTILSIDPSPQAEIDGICDTVIRERLEDTAVELFDQLEAGDVLFFDGSHHAFMSSDVVVFFLEILPRLPPGVLVHIHDIFLPYDYPAEWSDRYYSEQYLLAVALMARQRSFDVIFPAYYVARDPELSRLIGERCGRRAEGSSGSFWIRTSGPG
jgi:Methyltransferase domain